ncbi:hypothetical protein EAF04_010858 [Stromatinia cepivora]|nr:hypothetical protein EAF04_010858 [Stromatinia cepivora]
MANYFGLQILFALSISISALPQTAFARPKFNTYLQPVPSHRQTIRDYPPLLRSYHCLAALALTSQCQRISFQTASCVTIIIARCVTEDSLGTTAAAANANEKEVSVGDQEQCHSKMRARWKISMQKPMWQIDNPVELLHSVLGWQEYNKSSARGLTAFRPLV